MLPLLALLACTPEPVDTGEPPDPDALDDTDLLEAPALSDAEVETLVAQAILLSTSVGPQAAWVGLPLSMDRAEAGCPDLYIGDAPSGLATADGGWAWEDDCTTSAGVRFDGAMWWSTSAGRGGDDGNYVLSAERAVVGDGRVTSGGAALYSLSGDWTDSARRTITGSKESFDYSSTFELSVSGTDAFASDSATPSGWRAVGTATASGGDGSLSEVDLEQDMYFFSPVLDGQIDAIAEEIRWSFNPDGGSSGGSGCPVEPYGWVSVRLADGTWIDVPFLNEGVSGANDTAEQEEEACDGCATWYVYGQAQGQICPDLGPLWDGRLEPPSVEEMVYTPRLVGGS